MITATNLNINFGQAHVLKGLEFSFAKNQLHVLCGPNGSGKTTLLRHLAGLQIAASGEAHIDGRLISSLTLQERKHTLAWVPSEHSMTFDYTPRDVIGWGQKSESSRSLHIDTVLDVLALGPLLDRPMTELSLGEQKRAHLARALASDSHYVFLDEPCAALDPASALDLMAWLRQETSAGRRTILASLHDLSLALNYAHTATLLCGGRIACTGHPHVVFNSEQLTAILGVKMLTNETAHGKTSLFYREP